jgi:hypothetical protein
VEADGLRRTAIADSLVRLRRMALEDGPGIRRMATPSGGRMAVSPPSTGCGGRWPRRLPGRRPADADADVRTRDNPILLV